MCPRESWPPDSICWDQLDAVAISGHSVFVRRCLRVSDDENPSVCRLRPTGRQYPEDGTLFNKDTPARPSTGADSNALVNAFTGHNSQEKKACSRFAGSLVHDTFIQQQMLPRAQSAVISSPTNCQIISSAASWSPVHWRVPCSAKKQARTGRRPFQSETA